MASFFSGSPAYGIDSDFLSLACRRGYEEGVRFIQSRDLAGVYVRPILCG